MAEQMELFQILMTQHEELAEMLTKLAESGDSDERKMLFPTLQQELLAHAKAEEQTLYEAIASAGGKAAAPEIEESKREHQDIADALAQMDALDVDDEAWEEELRSLTEIVLEHVEEEESDLFAMARALLDDDALAKLSEDFQAQYEQELVAPDADTQED